MSPQYPLPLPPSSSRSSRTSSSCRWNTPSSNTDTSTSSDMKTTATPLDCYFRFHPHSSWRKRIQLKDLQVGQLLHGVLLKKNHLLNGTTGPKVFFECGVGRINPKNEWNMVNGMCRLGSAKASVIKKRIQRLSRQSDTSTIPLYVSKIRLDSQQLEVSLSEPLTTTSTSTSTTETATAAMPTEKRISASQLQPNQELVGTIIEIRDYGVLIDVNANRNGLLHIQKVANLNGCYIDKSKGLEKAGLELGTKVRVCVESNEKKRLFLDFTVDVKEEARLARLEQIKLDRKEEEEVTTEKEVELVEEDVEEDDGSPDYDEAAWAEFAAADDYYDYDNEEEGDEDRDIEDSLGIGYY